MEIIPRSSKGDELAGIPLQTVEGSDFFTEAIFTSLEKGEADIAVHSLKDMSHAHFSGSHVFAVIDRDDPRDIALFNPDTEKKISRGETLVVGTCSPRREEMALQFLRIALPQLHPAGIRLQVKPIRGNVETRLQKLARGEYDATILATAGLNRLLRDETMGPVIRSLLKDRKKMLLPLLECVPAPCQGAIVAEAYPGNEKAVRVVQAINRLNLFTEAKSEKDRAQQYGSGCEQRFGVTTIRTGNREYLYAAGVDAAGQSFVHWYPEPLVPAWKGVLFSATDRMRDFFTYKRTRKEVTVSEPALFISNYKLCNYPDIPGLLQGKQLFVSGTRTWLEMARLGYWVEGSADALGLENFLPVLAMPLFGLPVNAVHILTHDSAALRWNEKGYKATGLHKTEPLDDPSLVAAIQQAGAVFWSSYAQFEWYGHLCAKEVLHLCPGGETASALQKAGIAPVIFPTIKAFEQWRTSAIR